MKKVTGRHIRANRPILVPSVPVLEGIEIQHGCQFISSLVRALTKLPGGIGRFLPKTIGILSSSCLKAAREVLGYPKGSASELLDGTLKLRHCTTIFTMRFPPWSLPRVGNGGGKRWYVTPGHLSDDHSNVVNRVQLTRKTCPSASSHVTPDPGHPTLKRRKRLRSPSSEGEGG